MGLRSLNLLLMLTIDSELKDLAFDCLGDEFARGEAKNEASGKSACSIALRLLKY